MKKISISSWPVLLVSSLFLLLSSCKKEELQNIPLYESGEMTFGRASGKKAHLDWIASGIGVKQSDSLFWAVRLGTVSKEGFLRESLTLGFIPLATGQYSIAQEYKDDFLTSSYNTSQDDGDVGEDYYLLDEYASTNIAQITKVDTIENKIEGIFTATFEIRDVEKKVNPDNPNRVTFSDVSFSVEILP